MSPSCIKLEDWTQVRTCCKEAITVFAKMECQTGGDEKAPKQTERSQAEWKKKAKHKTKLQNRMAAFPGSAVKFPRCRLKLEEEEAKQMKERMSSRNFSDLNKDEGMLPGRETCPQYENKREGKKHLNGK